jgi:hypothetical protein
MYTGKLWDKKSPINGVSAEKIVAMYKLTSKSTVGLVCDASGRVALVVCNPGFNKAEVERLLAEQVEAMNIQAVTESESDNEHESGKEFESDNKDLVTDSQDSE